MLEKLDDVMEQNAVVQITAWFTLRLNCCVW